MASHSWVFYLVMGGDRLVVSGDSLVIGGDSLLVVGDSLVCMNVCLLGILLGLYKTQEQLR